jgi:hypothetical protein
VNRVTYGISDGVSGLLTGGGRLMKVGCDGCDIMTDGCELDMLVYKCRDVAGVEEGGDNQAGWGGIVEACRDAACSAMVNLELLKEGR